MDKKDELRNIIDNSKYLVFFGGAGVSTASNIPDFRSSKGIYNEKYGNIPIESIISHSFFMRNTDIFYEIYKSKLCFPDALPNECHKALKRLEDKEILKAVITQNIDSLHEMAGSKTVIKLHGSVSKNRCMDCGKPYSLEYVMKSEKTPRCTCGGIVKPEVVLYEEPLDEETVYNAIRHIQKADTLIIGGTSLVVYPAAMYIEYFKGKNLVIINMDETSKDSMADLVIHEDISKVFEGIGE